MNKAHDELVSRIQESHPTFTHGAFRTDEFYAHFSDGPPMEVCEFAYGSWTRYLMAALEKCVGDGNNN